ncbi:acyl--CoA ligase, partial [Candidatus Fermentibacterales bacterium]|nr:acyl--CoA ligase [Candidatus Fermentibacterales bacterium]
MAPDSPVIHDLLDEAAARIPDAVALVDDDYEITFSDWRRVSLHLAKSLQSMGVHKGDIVGAYLGKTLLLPCLFTAVSRLGAQFMALVPGWPEQTYSRTFGRWPRRFVVVESDRCRDVYCDTEWSSLTRASVLDGSETPYSLPEVSPEDVVYLNITSASTGQPKVASTTHRHLIANTRGVCEALEMAADDVHMSLFGVIGHPHELFARGLFLGGKTVLTESPYPRSVIQRVSAQRVTALMGLPPQLEGISRLYRRADADLSSLRFAEAGGMHFSQLLCERFQERTGVPIRSVWGSTETSGVVLIGDPGRTGFDRVVPGYEVEIRKTEEVVAGSEHGVSPETGELWVSGEGVVAGYHGDRAETAESFREGWYRTGDIFKREGGRLVFLGRRGGLI